MPHPVIEVIQHLISPLATSLGVFSLNKASHAQAMSTFVTAQKLLTKEAIRGLLSKRPVPCKIEEAKKGGGTQAKLQAPQNLVNRRGFSTLANQRSNARVVARSSFLLTSGTTSRSISTEHLFFAREMVPILQSMHSMGGMPWWASIVAMTTALRFVVFPFNLGLVRNTRRLEQIQSDIDKFEAIMRTGSEEERLNAAKSLKELFAKHHCHPLKNLISPLLMLPLFASMFGAVNHLCAIEPAMATEGLLWFPNLAMPDTTWLLPVISDLTWLASFELGAGRLYHFSPKFQSYIRMIALAFIPVTSPLPSGVFVLWITSNMFIIMRSLMLEIPVVQKFFRIPPRSH